MVTRRLTSPPRRSAVRQPAAQRAGEQRQQAEAAGRHAGLAQRQVEVVDVIHGGDVVDEDLDAEAGAVGDEQQPGAVVGGSLGLKLAQPPLPALAVRLPVLRRSS